MLSVYSHSDKRHDSHLDLSPLCADCSLVSTVMEDTQLQPAVWEFRLCWMWWKTVTPLVPSRRGEASPHQAHFKHFSNASGVKCINTTCLSNSLSNRIFSIQWVLKGLYCHRCVQRWYTEGDAWVQLFKKLKHSYRLHSLCSLHKNCNWSAPIIFLDWVVIVDCEDSIYSSRSKRGNNIIIIHALMYK